MQTNEITVIIMNYTKRATSPFGPDFQPFSLFASQTRRRGRFSSLGLSSSYSSLLSTNERIFRLIYRSVFLFWTLLNTKMVEWLSGKKNKRIPILLGKII